MSAPETVFKNNQPPQCEDKHLNAFTKEINNAISAAGFSLNESNTAQLAQSLINLSMSGTLFDYSGTANSITLTPMASKAAPASYYDGMRVMFLSTTANTGPATVNLAGLGVKPIKTEGGSELSGGEIIGFVELVFFSGPSEFKISKLGGQPVSLASRVGEIGEFHSSVDKPGWVDLKGGSLSRATDKLLWDYANAAGMVVSQSVKDGDPMANAMKFGDGDGTTTFTLPNHHLGHFVRGNPTGVNHGDTQGDAIREITGAFAAYDESSGTGSGAFGDSVVSTGLASGGPIGRRNNFNFAASRVVPTANENRPYAANLSIKIHRGWV